MGSAVTVEVTFVATAAAAEGVIRMPDDTLHPFSGWIDLLALLETAASVAAPHLKGTPS
jgi:hypothetical protein